jgi:hypothetical protein
MRLKAFRGTTISLAGAIFLIALASFWIGRNQSVSSIPAAGVPTLTEPSKAHAKMSGPNNAVRSATGKAEIPAQYRLQGISEGAVADSFDEWMKSFPADREALSKFSEEHFGVYKINSPQQIAWMAANGFPMPEDVIAAQSISNDELRNLAEKGNSKAALILYGRDIDELKTKLEAAIERTGSAKEFWQHDPDAAFFRDQRDRDNALIAKTNSPYKGYVLARAAVLENDPIAASAKVAAGLLVAAYLGDSRAINLLDAYVGTDTVRGAMVMAAELTNNALLEQVSESRGIGCVRADSVIPNAFEAANP